MVSQLREVLNRFEDQSVPVSISHLAHEMGLEVGIVRDMIGYWVRKGRLREVGVQTATCHTCGVHGACPFVVTLPVYYEVVRAGDDTSVDAPCACGVGGCG
ncbi:MAG: hypothetical protein IPM16_01170 [Chloroflexi bacterium]|nr:hypothetical protein [Chloroflexota bacterium]